MTQGSSFSIRGKISSGNPISSVTVGVYDTNGKMKIGKTVSPNTTSYNLKNIDTSIKFGSLAASGYRYKVTAVTASGTTTLVNTAFMVLSNRRTISNGTDAFPGNGDCLWFRTSVQINIQCRWKFSNEVCFGWLIIIGHV